MEIVWLAHSCFRLRAREATVVTDPPAKDYGPLGALQAEIVTVSHHHPGHDNREAVAGDPVWLDRPGEYEVRDVVIRGLRTYHDTSKGQDRGRNTVFLMELEGVTVCHLGDLGHPLSAGQVEDLGNVDVLLVPVGGVSTLNATQAAEIISLVTPKIVIPMHYQDRNREDLEPLDRFLKEMTAAELEPQPRLQITRSSLPADTQVVVLERRRV